MAITDISISEELETNAPSIKYRGNEGPKSPQEMQQMMMAGPDRYFQILEKFIVRIFKNGLFVETLTKEGIKRYLLVVEFVLTCDCISPS